MKIKTDTRYIDEADFGYLYRQALGVEWTPEGDFDSWGYTGYWCTMSEDERRASRPSVERPWKDCLEIIKDYFNTDNAEIVKDGNGDYRIFVWSEEEDAELDTVDLTK